MYVPGKSDPTAVLVRYVLCGTDNETAGMSNMIFTEADDDEYNQLTHRRVSMCGRVEIGVYRVLYGYRIRAGFVGCPACELDWCAGDDWLEVQVLYSICLGILAQRPNAEECFDHIPRSSAVKPYFRDARFVSRLRELLPVVEPIKLDRDENPAKTA